ncbi:uncharacterized protein [Rutidosis leptorrhynchoides]|uniref:uncharacterized protein n=1 Tax=Rutidosis leptorrhynchoides TaxID=125765 RepID=UPI003A99B2FD
MEGLHLAFHRAMATNLIRGIQVGGIRLSHFLYADDVIILSEWHRNELHHILLVLQIFYLVSGLKINVAKSHIFGIGVDIIEVDNFSLEAGCCSGTFPTMYLGVPIGANMKRVSSWDSLIDKFRSNLATWKACLLS